MKNIEFRVVLYFSRNDSGGFYGGRLAASPLANYYHAKKKGKVLLGSSFILGGLGKHHSKIHSYLRENTPIKHFPLCIKDDFGNKIVFSKKGYIYQNEDPIYGSSGSGICWEFDIEKVGEFSDFSKSELMKYFLPSTLIGIKEWRDCEDFIEAQKEIPPQRTNYSILASNLRLLKHPLTPYNPVSKLLRIYSGDWKTISFYKNDCSLSIPRNNTFVHLPRNHNWSELSNGGYRADEDLTYKQIAHDELENNHITESLVHELLKIRIANEGKWHMNDELPVPGKKKGRIDFLIKKSLNNSDPWTLVELKKGDGLNAVAQLDNYIKCINRETKRHKGNVKKNPYFVTLWDVNRNRVKTLKGVILCAKEQITRETENEAKKKGFEIWPYTIRLESKSKNNLSCKNCKPLFWIDLETKKK
jgi:hypothetical protein